MRLLLRVDGEVRRFMKFEVSPRDGSVLILFQREGVGQTVSSRVHPASGVEERETLVERRRGAKVTLHASGRVNYDGRHAPIYIDPLWCLEEEAALVGYYVPDLRRLDVFNRSASKSDLIIDASTPSGEPVTFEVVASPATAAPLLTPFASLTVPAGPRLDVYASHGRLPFVPADLSETFITIFPEQGTRQEQQIEEDLALIGYFRALRGKDFSAPMGPNGAGEYRVIFPVQMRVAPVVSIRTVDESLYVAVIDQTSDVRTNRVQVRFQVRERESGNLVRRRVKFAEMEFDAELH